MIRINTKRWLRANNVKDDDILTVVNEGKYLNSNELPFTLPRGRKSIFEITVKLPDGTTIPWLMNTTTQGRCVDAWGEETKNWIGKCLSVELKEQNVSGQIRAVIYGVPVN